MLMAICVAAGAQAPESTVLVEFRITAPTMVAALMQFSEQARIQLVVPTDEMDDILAPRVVGALTPRDALDHLLRGSGLRYEFVNVRTVSVSLAKAQTSRSR